MMEAMSSILFLWGMPGPTEWVIIAIVVLLLFGGTKIPELMRGLGKGVKEFKEATNDDEKGQGSAPSSDEGRKDPDQKDR